eukprot:2595433-Ditylum_brightwellii.AAC.1
MEEQQQQKSLPSNVNNGTELSEEQTHRYNGANAFNSNEKRTEELKDNTPSSLTTSNTSHRVRIAECIKTLRNRLS